MKNEMTEVLSPVETIIGQFHTIIGQFQDSDFSILRFMI
jgi:hypothetical protein